MYKRNIKYVDFDGVDQDAEVYFHLSKSKLFKFVGQFGNIDELQDRIAAMVGTANVAELIALFETLIIFSYGERIDAKTFRQSEQLSQDFLDTAIYDALFTELLTNAGKAVEFFNCVIPQDVLKAMPKEITEPLAEIAGVPVEDEPVDSNRPLTPEESAKVEEYLAVLRKQLAE